MEKSNVRIPLLSNRELNSLISRTVRFYKMDNGQFGKYTFDLETLTVSESDTPGEYTTAVWFLNPESMVNGGEGTYVTVIPADDTEVCKKSGLSCREFLSCIVQSLHPDLVNAFLEQDYEDYG